MSCTKPQEIPTLALPLDTRSPEGSKGRRFWALVLNAQADVSGRVLRLGGWRRFGWESIDLGTFVNQDLHDQLPDCSGSALCSVPTSVVISQTGEYADGAKGLGIQHNGAQPSRVRWYRDDVLIYDSQA